MLLIVCTVLPLLYGVSANYVANQFLDSVLLGLPAQVRAFSLDPAALSDFTIDFVDKVAIIGKVKVKVNYTDGQLTGLSNVRRISECGGPTYKFGVPTINCTIGFQQLSTVYKGKMKYGKLPVVSVKGKGNVTTTSVFLEVASTSPTQPPSLSKFDYVQIGKLDTEFTGLGSPMNKLLKVLEDDYKSKVGATLMNYINQRFREAFNAALYHVQMPR